MSAYSLVDSFRPQDLGRRRGNENLRDQIAGLIERYVADKRLQAGDRLPSERELARRLGVSRTPVRGAIRLLEQRGLVNMRVGSGTYVIGISPSTVAESIERYCSLSGCSYEDVVEVKGVLEPEIAALAAVRATPEDLARLGELVEEIDEARAQEVIITCRPIHGLEMYDILTLSSPPWGGANVVGRVVAIREEYNTKQGRWQQRITLGYPSQYTYLARDGSTILNIDAANVIAHDLAQITQYTGALSVDGILKLVTDGVLHSGQTAYNTGTGFWLEYNSGTPRLSIGDATNEKITWDGTTLTVEGDLTAGSGNPVYPMVPLTAPLTSAAWDGDSFSTTAKTKIDLSDVFSAPAGIKAVLVEVEIRDSASAANDCYLILAPNNTAGQGIAFTCPAVDDRRGRFCALVPCDGSGDIYYQIVASGASTFDIKLEIWGYLI